MKFQPDQLAGTNAVTRIEPGRLWVGTQPWTTSVLVPWQGDVHEWAAVSAAELTEAHFARIVALAPAVVIFGSGARIRFPAPALIRPLIEARIGVETMDTGAAARTYNVLAAEGRTVVGAFILEGSTASL